MLKLYSLQAIQDVMSWFVHHNRFGEIKHYINCSLMDPLQWMGAIRMGVQTADKSITIIHTTPVHHLTSWSVKLCFCIKTFLTPNCCWNESSIHNIAFSIESHLVWIRIEIGTDLVYKQNSPCWWILMRNNREWTFSSGERIMMDYGVCFSWKQQLSLRCFYQLFGLILTAPIHCRGSLVSKWCNDKVLMTKTNLHLGWPEGE